MSRSRDVEAVTNSNETTRIGTHALTDSSAKPRRAARPCDACRRRKTRCIIPSDAQQCTACIQRKGLCQFVERPPDRSRKRQQVTATGFELEQTSPRSIGLPSAPRTESLNGEPSPGPVSIQVSSEAGVALGSPVPSVRTMRHFQEDREMSLGQAVGRFSELYGLTSDMEPILMASYPCR